MDTPATEPSTAPLSTDQAAGAFAALLDPPVEQDKVEQTDDAPVVEATTEAEATPEAEAEEGAIEVEVDGKPVTLTKAQIAEAYKNGLRQADYTKKTMEAAEQRKNAEAETAKAQQERQRYAEGLHRNVIQLDAAINEYQNVDWEKLMQEDPAAAQIHMHRFQTRQAERQRQMQELQQVEHVSKVEASTNFEKHIAQQQDLLLAKFPQWKSDPKKGAEARELVAKYLIEDMGFKKEEVFAEKDSNGIVKHPGITDHRAIIMAYEAAKYRELMSKAPAATKKVSALPQKVERPGAGEAPSLDRRNAAFQKLSKSGKVEDAAAAFATFL